MILDAIQEVQSAPPDPDKQEELGQFRQLTGQFQIDVMNSVLSNPPEPKKIVVLLNSHGESIESIGLGGLDISELFQEYKGKVFRIFNLGLDLR